MQWYILPGQVLVSEPGKSDRSGGDRSHSQCLARMIKQSANAEIEITWKYYFTYINELFQPALSQLFTIPSSYTTHGPPHELYFF